MQPLKRLVIVAGEESGDQHASVLARQLRANYPDLNMTGIGGKHMQAAGVHLLSDLARFGVTGLVEILRHARVIRQAYRAICEHLKTNKPDLLILVDYPGFNLRLAKFAKRKLGIRILYYISPQIWAWKPGRINLIRDCVDHMAVILPFEKKIYEEAGVPVSFVGHPLVQSINRVEHAHPTREALGLPLHQPIIALLPGSRINEIEHHMPVLCETAIRLANRYPEVHFVIPIAGTIEPALIQRYWIGETPPCTFIQGNALTVVACSDYVIVGSGTASLECALLTKPMCIIYKVSLLTYLVATIFIRVKYLGLCNLLKNSMIVPELLQYDCNPTELTCAIASLMDDTDVRQRMVARLTDLKQTLSFEEADTTLYQLVERMLF